MTSSASESTRSFAASRFALRFLFAQEFSAQRHDLLDSVEFFLPAGLGLHCARLNLLEFPLPNDASLVNGQIAFQSFHCDLLGTGACSWSADAPVLTIR